MMRCFQGIAVMKNNELRSLPETKHVAETPFSRLASVSNPSAVPAPSRLRVTSTENVMKLLDAPCHALPPLSHIAPLFITSCLAPPCDVQLFFLFFFVICSSCYCCLLALKHKIERTFTVYYFRWEFYCLTFTCVSPSSSPCSSSPSCQTSQSICERFEPADRLTYFVTSFFLATLLDFSVFAFGLTLSLLFNAAFAATLEMSVDLKRKSQKTTWPTLCLSKASVRYSPEVPDCFQWPQGVCQSLLIISTSSYLAVVDLVSGFCVGAVLSVFNPCHVYKRCSELNQARLPCLCYAVTWDTPCYLLSTAKIIVYSIFPTITVSFVSVFPVVYDLHFSFVIVIIWVVSISIGRALPLSSLNSLLLPLWFLLPPTCSSQNCPSLSNWIPLCSARRRYTLDPSELLHPP